MRMTYLPYIQIYKLYLAYDMAYTNIIFIWVGIEAGDNPLVLRGVKHWCMHICDSVLHIQDFGDKKR
jgi:hypothetical protein